MRSERKSLSSLKARNIVLIAGKNKINNVKDSQNFRKIDYNNLADKE